MSTPQDPFATPSEPAGGSGRSGQPAGHGGSASAGASGWGPVSGHEGAPGEAYAGRPVGGYGTQPVGTRPKGMAIAALVLGILAVLTSITVLGGVVLGIVALVLGIIAARQAARGMADGRGMAIAGAVLGGLGILLSIGLIAAGVALFNSDSGKKLQDCLDSAGDDQAAVQQCEQEFKNNVSR